VKLPERDAAVFRRAFGADRIAGVKSLLLKLFLVLLATVSAVVVVMMVLTRWSFDRGFMGYLDGMQQTKMEAIVRRVEEYYAQHGTWDQLVPGSREWVVMTHPGEGMPATPRSEGVPPGPAGQWEAPTEPLPPGAFPPPMITDITDIGPRVSLFTPDGRKVIGRARSMQGMVPHPVRYQGEIVGVLTLTPVTTPGDRRDAAFAQQQRQDLYLIACVVIAFAAVSAWLVARRLLDPIHVLATSARRLAAGEYEVRVKINGQDELTRLGEDFNRLAEALQANESARRRWIADISHELRTPIAVLRGEIEALQDGVRSANDNTIDSLHGEAVQLGKLVEDLYQLAIADQGALTYHKEPTDLSELLARVLGSAAPRFEEAGLALELRGTETPIMVLADPDRLVQLVTNLIQNCLRYTDRGGRVVVAWTQTAGSAQIEMQDSAPAVPTDALPRLFERLYRVDSSRNRARGGAGLGLAIVKAIVDAHQGVIEARPSPLGGLWLHMEFPLYREERR
jgi:two-component system sensor histidine kinase BaeS